MTKPCCQTGPKWISDRFKRELGVTDALAPLTGQDARALSAFLHLVALYGNSDATGRRVAVLAMAYTVRAMQPHTRHLAGIPHVLDWSHEAEIWQQLEALDAEALKDALAAVSGVMDRWQIHRRDRESL